MLFDSHYDLILFQPKVLNNRKQQFYAIAYRLVSESGYLLRKKHGGRGKKRRRFLRLLHTHFIFQYALCIGILLLLWSNMIIAISTTSTRK
jgi:hypothetical protein